MFLKCSSLAYLNMLEITAKAQHNKGPSQKKANTYQANIKLNKLFDASYFN